MSTGSVKAGPANSEAPSTSNTFEAAAAVFAIPELLYLVIEAVPREKRTSLRQVSKAWKTAISKPGGTKRRFRAPIPDDDNQTKVLPACMYKEESRAKLEIS
jgi:hypothetical protein